jgi:hypothetical protein
MVDLVGCTTPLVVRTEPHRASVYLNDELVSEQTPVQLVLDRRAFARGTDHMRVVSDGYRPVDVEVAQVSDGSCLVTSAIVFVFGLSIILPSLASLAHMPWCTRAEEEIFVELERVGSEEAAANPEGCCATRGGSR